MSAPNTRPAHIYRLSFRIGGTLNYRWYAHQGWARKALARNLHKYPDQGHKLERIAVVGDWQTLCGNVFRDSGENT